MSRAIRFEDEAEQEYRAAARWYDDQRAGLGTEFLDTVDATLAHIVRFPRAGVLVPRVPPELRVRRAPVKRFPYHIVYINVETEATIRVIMYWLTGATRQPAVSVMWRPPALNSSYGSILVHCRCAPYAANRSTCSLR